MVAKLALCVFRGVATMPVYLAEDLGIFEQAGLDVAITPTRSSDELMEGLIGGSFQIVHANPDNFIAWRDRTHAPVVAWVGGSIGPIRLVGSRGLEHPSQLRGRIIAVDSPKSGWVPILRRILKEAGLTDDDYRLEPVGATRYVFEAVRDGAADASMQSMPWWLRSDDLGLSMLADHRSVVPRLQGSCGASLEPWLVANREIAGNYLSCVVAATSWMYSPRNRDDLVRRMERILDMSRAHARTAVETMLDSSGGWPPSAFIDAAGFSSVWELRRDVVAEQPAMEPDRYYTLDPYMRVMSFGLGSLD